MVDKYKGIGIGGVMAEIAFLDSDGQGVLEENLVENLAERHSVCKCVAESSLEMAKLCGVAYEEKSRIYLRHRPD